ncbi:hypothetical protein HAX54_032808 [Datura stramonium]|uniref:Uncharacterized protein n=1 Tax=Datura stramonium TaxID=4076 RepID=A0ABS8SCV9_DATST|nr:hypothetical protein [Datura stramonium]
MYQDRSQTLEYAIPMNVDEGVSTDLIYEENTVPGEDAGTEECVLSNQDDSNHQCSRRCLESVDERQD